MSLGKAKYEPEYAAVVWRIDQLPSIHSKIPADAPQTFICVLDLPPGMEYIENYKPTAELDYGVAYVLVTDATVIAVKVSNQYTENYNLTGLIHIFGNIKKKKKSENELPYKRRKRFSNIISSP